jgi:uncharacterized protein YjbI with pentapeptide repeats
MRYLRKFSAAISGRSRDLVSAFRQRSAQRLSKRNSDWRFVKFLGIFLFVLGLIVGLTGHMVDNYVSHTPNIYDPSSICSKEAPKGALEEIAVFFQENFSPLRLFLDFYNNISTSLIFTAITILVVDRAYEVRSEQHLLGQLKRQMGSKYNQISLEAIKELTEINALFNGSLNGIDLRSADLTGAILEGGIAMNANLENATLLGASMSGIKLDGSNLNYANLKDAKLVGASLRGCRFYQANMSSTDLSWADLTASELITEDQLKGCNALWGATLPDGEKYDGSYDLKGDIDEARKYGVNYDDPEDRSRFYAQTK